MCSANNRLVLCSQRCRMIRAAQVHEQWKLENYDPVLDEKLGLGFYDAIYEKWITDSGGTKMEFRKWENRLVRQLGNPLPAAKTLAKRLSSTSIVIKVDENGAAYVVVKGVWLKDIFLPRRATVWLNPERIVTQALLKCGWIQ